MNDAVRFWAKVEVRESEDCWLWQASLDRDGYGRFAINRRHAALAHRVAYEMAVGLVPSGLELDHLCRVRSCVNPAHLEAVTHRENTMRGEGACATNARKTHCANGHAFDDANTYWYNGWRLCRACNRAAVARYKAREFS